MRFVQEETNTECKLLSIINQRESLSVFLSLTRISSFLILGTLGLEISSRQQTEEAFETIRLMESLHLIGDKLS